MPRLLKALMMTVVSLSACAGRLSGESDSERCADPGTVRLAATDAHTAKVAGALGAEWREGRLPAGFALTVTLTVERPLGEADLRTLAHLRAESIVPVKFDETYLPTGAVSVTALPAGSPSRTWLIEMPSEALRYLVGIPWVARVTAVNGYGIPPSADPLGQRMGGGVRGRLEALRTQRLSGPYQVLTGFLTFLPAGKCPSDEQIAAVSNLGVLVHWPKECRAAVSFEAPDAVVMDLASLPDVIIEADEGHFRPERGRAAGQSLSE